MSIKIAITNEKGGCGKTTSAVNISAILAERGYRVLLADVDPQSYATMYYGLYNTDDPSLYDAITGVWPVNDAIVKTVFGVDVLKSNTKLMKLEEICLSTLSSILSIILLSIIFKNVYSSLLFLYTFFFLRLFSGGYHAPTYSKCFILTNAIFAFVYLLSEVIQWYKPLLIPFAILSCISIFLLSPIRSTKHPLSERLYAQNKKTARIIVSIDFLLFLILYITGMPTRYLATWALSLSAVAIMMVITLFEKNSTRRESV